TWDFEFQHEFRPVTRHSVLWGGDARYQSDRLDNLSPAAFAFLPDDRVLRTGALFVEDQVALHPRVDLIAGVRLEHNEYTGPEWMPSVRVGWKPRRDQFAWASWSRAVRAPSRIDREFFAPGTPPFVVLAGGPDFESEIANAGEIGWRAQPLPAVSWSITGFVHDYDRLRSLEPSPAGP